MRSSTCDATGRTITSGSKSPVGRITAQQNPQFVEVPNFQVLLRHRLSRGALHPILQISRAIVHTRGEPKSVFRQGDFLL